MDEDCYMPSLPPHLRKTLVESATSHTEAEGQQHQDAYADSEEENDEYCPALPPHMIKEDSTPKPTSRRSLVGPLLPTGIVITQGAAEDDTTNLCHESKDEEPLVGPLPSQEKFDPKEYKAREIEERAKRMQDKLEGRETDPHKPMKRESWMTELPKDKVNFCGLEARQFLRKTPVEKGDTSVWTDTPADTAKKAKEKLNHKEESCTLEEDAVHHRDVELTKKVDEYNKTKRAKALVDLHRKELKRKQNAESPKERRPFSREEDLCVNKFDEAQRATVLKKARQLNDRFSSGKAKFL